MTKVFKVPFATQGDRVAIPVETQADGSVSYTQGYGYDYERDQVTDPAAKDIEREKMNDVFHDITEATGEMQVYGAAKWNVGGKPYPVMGLVYHADKIWQSKIANNNDEPATGSSWQELKADISEQLVSKVDKSQISDSVTSSSSITVASSKAVKDSNDNAESRVPLTRKVNGKALSNDINITLAELGAVDALYPVGIVIFFAENKNPNTLFPGTTWKYVGEERTIRLGKMDGSDLKELGGFDTVSLSVANMPAHAHTFSATSSAFDYGTKTVSTFDYGTKTSNTTGNHTHNGRIAQGVGQNTIAGGQGDLVRSSAVMDAAGNHAHTVDIGAHNHTVGIGDHTHSVSGTTSSVGSGAAVNITNSYIKLMGWYRSA